MAVGTVKKSIAAMPSRWFRRKVVQVALALGVPGGPVMNTSTHSTP